MLQFFDRNGQPVEIERTSFIKFIDEADVSAYTVSIFIRKLVAVLLSRTLLQVT